jgi:hypothetical protein
MVDPRRGSIPPRLTHPPPPTPHITPPLTPPHLHHPHLHHPHLTPPPPHTTPTSHHPHLTSPHLTPPHLTSPPLSPPPTPHPSTSPLRPIHATPLLAVITSVRPALETGSGDVLATAQSRPDRYSQEAASMRKIRSSSSRFLLLSPACGPHWKPAAEMSLPPTLRLSAFRRTARNCQEFPLFRACRDWPMPKVASVRIWPLGSVDIAACQTGISPLTAVPHDYRGRLPPRIGGVTVHDVCGNLWPLGRCRSAMCPGVASRGCEIRQAVGWLTSVTGAVGRALARIRLISGRLSSA